MRKEKTIEGKHKKHLLKIEDKEYWRFDNGTLREIPEVDKRHALIKEVHERLFHRGIEPIYCELKKSYYWVGIKDSIKEVIRRRQICNENNRKNNRGCEFVTSTKPMERVAIDIMHEEQANNDFLIVIDYFTRMCRIRKNSKKKFCCY